MRTAAGDAFSSVAVQLMLLAARLELEGDALAQAAQQSSARWRVLAALEDGPRTVASVARRLELKRQSVQRLADALVSEGLLAASDNPEDQRAALHALTATGTKALRRIQAEQIGWANRLGAKVGRDRLLTLATELEHLRHVLTHPEPTK